MNMMAQLTAPQGYEFFLNLFSPENSLPPTANQILDTEVPATFTHQLKKQWQYQQLKFKQFCAVYYRLALFDLAISDELKTRIKQWGLAQDLLLTDDPDILNELSPIAATVLKVISNPQVHYHPVTQKQKFALMELYLKLSPAASFEAITAICQALGLSEKAVHDKFADNYPTIATHPSHEPKSYLSNSLLMLGIAAALACISVSMLLFPLIVGCIGVISLGSFGIYRLGVKLFKPLRASKANKRKTLADAKTAEKQTASTQASKVNAQPTEGRLESKAYHKLAAIYPTPQESGPPSFKSTLIGISISLVAAAALVMAAFIAFTHPLILMTIGTLSFSFYQYCQPPQAQTTTQQTSAKPAMPLAKPLQQLDSTKQPELPASSPQAPVPTASPTSEKPKITTTQGNKHSFFNEVSISSAPATPIDRPSPALEKHL